MEDKNNYIDQLFKEKQHQFDRNPNQRVWRQLEARLDQEKSSRHTRKKINHNMAWIAAAVLFILLLPAYFIISNWENTWNKEVAFGKVTDPSSTQYPAATYEAIGSDTDATAVGVVLPSFESQAQERMASSMPQVPSSVLPVEQAETPSLMAKNEQVKPKPSTKITTYENSTSDKAVNPSVEVVLNSKPSILSDSPNNESSNGNPSAISAMPTLSSHQEDEGDNDASLYEAKTNAAHRNITSKKKGIAEHPNEMNDQEAIVLKNLTGYYSHIQNEEAYDHSDAQPQAYEAAPINELKVSKTKSTAGAEPSSSDATKQGPQLYIETLPNDQLRITITGNPNIKTIYQGGKHKDKYLLTNDKYPNSHIEITPENNEKLLITFRIKENLPWHIKNGRYEKK